MFGKSLTLPTKADALPGRAQPMRVPAAHFVNGNRLEPPFPDGLQRAMFAMGCFWGAERKFWQLPGVYTTAVGYAAGLTPNPTYREVCSGMTGHAEVVQVTYDPAEITFADLLRVFFQTHDPTTLNRQGHDVGTQYRSAVFYHDDRQRQIAEQYIRQLDDARTFSAPIVTEITPLKNFFPAENYHQDYFRSNPAQSYCAFVIRPKVEKFQEEFSDLLAR